MAARSASSLLSSLVLLVVGAVLGLAALKCYESFGQTKETKPAPTEVSKPTKATESVVTSDHAHLFWEDVRLTGSFGSDGWKGAATYKGEHGSSVTLGSAISAKGVQVVEAAVGYKAKDGQMVPSAELKAAVRPGTPGMQYSAKFHKTLPDGLEPMLIGQITNAGVSVGAAFRKVLNKAADFEMDVRVPLTRRKVDLTMDAKTSYKVGNGKVVGSLAGKASGGLRGVKAGLTYDLGM